MTRALIQRLFDQYHYPRVELEKRAEFISWPGVGGQRMRRRQGVAVL